MGRARNQTSAVNNFDAVMGGARGRDLNDELARVSRLPDLQAVQELLEFDRPVREVQTVALARAEMLLEREGAASALAVNKLVYWSQELLLSSVHQPSLRLQRHLDERLRIHLSNLVADDGAELQPGSYRVLFEGEMFLPATTASLNKSVRWNNTSLLALLRSRVPPAQQLAVAQFIDRFKYERKLNQRDASDYIMGMNDDLADARHQLWPFVAPTNTTLNDRDKRVLTRELVHSESNAYRKLIASVIYEAQQQARMNEREVRPTPPGELDRDGDTDAMEKQRNDPADAIAERVQQSLRAAFAGAHLPDAVAWEENYEPMVKLLAQPLAELGPFGLVGFGYTPDETKPLPPAAQVNPDSWEQVLRATIHREEGPDCKPVGEQLPLLSDVFKRTELHQLFEQAFRGEHDDQH